MEGPSKKKPPVEVVTPEGHDAYAARNIPEGNDACVAMNCAVQHDTPDRIFNVPIPAYHDPETVVFVAKAVFSGDEVTSKKTV